MKICNGMVQTFAAGTAVDVKFCAALGQSGFYGQHGIRVILLHRGAGYIFKILRLVHGVEIAQQFRGRDSGFLAIAVSCISGQNQVTGKRRFPQTIEGPGGKYKTAFHRRISFVV